MIVGIGGFALSRAKGSTGMWTPTALGANLGLWFDANDLGTFTFNGSTISQWQDKSGNNRHASQATPANQPTYTSNGLNGKPVVTFDGTNDFLNVTAFTGNRIQSTAVVTSTNNTTALQMIVDESNSASYLGGLSMYYLATGRCRYAAQDVNALTETTTAIVASQHNIICGVEGSSVRTISFNGTVEASAAPGTSARNAANPRIGNSALFGSFLNGTVAEIVIASTDLTTTNKQKLEGYLAWKWGLVSKLPGGHPYKNVPPGL